MNAQLKEYDLDDQDQKEMYDEMLNEVYFELASALENFCNVTPAEILEEHDPTAYRCGFNDWAGTGGIEDTYVCNYCGEEFDDEDEANECCMIECDTCGAKHEDEDGAKECCQDESDLEGNDNE